MAVRFSIGRRNKQKLIIVIIFLAFNFMWIMMYPPLQRQQVKQTSTDAVAVEFYGTQRCQQAQTVNCNYGHVHNYSGTSVHGKHNSSTRRLCDVTHLAKDCSSLKNHLGYADKPSSEIEMKFPLAYSIRMHKDPAQVEMLLRAVYAPQNVYCIYIDKKSPPHVHRSMDVLSRCFSNVFISSQLEPFYYGTSSQMMADLQCMKDLVSSSVQWKYYLNLAGQEFPLKTNRHIVQVLTVLNGTNDLEVGEYVDGLRWRYLNKVVRDGDGWFKFDGVKRDKLQLDITLYKGSAYGAFSRMFVEFLLSDRRVRHLRQWLSDTFAPEETLFATANALPGAPGGYKVLINQDVEVGQHISRVVIWQWTKFPACHGHYVRGVCILTRQDLSWLLDKPQLFANKFDINYDGEVIQCLLQRIIQERYKTPELDFDYLYSLPHVKYSRRSK